MTDAARPSRTLDEKLSTSGKSSYGSRPEDHEPDSWQMCRICVAPGPVRNAWQWDVMGPCPGYLALTEQVGAPEADPWFDYCPTCQGRYSDPVAHPHADRGCDEHGEDCRCESCFHSFCDCYECQPRSDND